MANPSPPSPPPQSSTILLFLILITAAATTSTATTYQEYESMMEALRTHGYTLFNNAITTSDLQYKLLNTNASAESEGNTEPTAPFTLFAPKDTLLFSLDMTSDAAEYVDTLRYHVIPYHRLTFADLQNLSSPFLDTLLPHYSVLIGKTQDGDVSFDNVTIGVIVDGVRVSHPDLFIGSRIAVHGIDGILVTGMNMNQYFDGNDTGPRILESPAPAVSELDGNIPVEGTLTPMSQFDWNNNIQVSPMSPFHWNTPAEKTFAPMSQFDWNNNNIPVSPVSPFDGNIPVAVPPKKKGKRRRKGRGHRRHKGIHDHRLEDL